MSSLVSLAIAVPLAAAAVAVLVRDSRPAQRVVAVSGLVVTLTLGAVLLAQESVPVATVGGWQPPVGVVLVADGLGSLLVVAAGVVGVAAVVAAALTGTDARPMFHPLVLALVAGANGAFLTADLFNLFVFFEVTLFASYGLLVVTSTRREVRAAAVYVPVGMLGSFVLLLGIAVLYAQLGTVNMAELATRTDVATAGAVPGALLLAGFAVKAALVPTSGWLPIAYPAAGRPVGALFAGLLTTVGVVGIYRTLLLVYGGDADAHALLRFVAIVTMLAAGVAAVGQDRLSDALAFVVVAQVGFMVLGAALGTVAGVAAGIFFVSQDMVVKAAAFLSVPPPGGRRPGPILLLASASLAGLPLTAGFVGKLLLVRAAVAEGAWVSAAAAVAAGFLVLAALVRHVPLAWGAGEAFARSSAVPATILLLTLALAVWPGPLLAVTTDAAEQLVDRSGFAAEVLP